MNKLIQAIKQLDLVSVQDQLQKKPGWIFWCEDSGKNALHYLCALNLADDERKTAVSLDILKLLLQSGMDINSTDRIPEKGSDFPARPLWYAYAKGRNETLYRYLLENGADPQHCMFAIAWNDDVEAAELFKSYGAPIDESSGDSSPFLAAYLWKRFAVAEWFLANGADVNAPDADGNTALFYAVNRRYKHEHIELLLRFAANPNIQNNQGISPLRLAEQNHQRDVLRLFSSLKAS